MTCVLTGNLFSIKSDFTQLATRAEPPVEYAALALPHANTKFAKASGKLSFMEPSFVSFVRKNPQNLGVGAGNE